MSVPILPLCPTGTIPGKPRKIYCYERAAGSFERGSPIEYFDEAEFRVKTGTIAGWNPDHERVFLAVDADGHGTWIHVDHLTYRLGAPTDGQGQAQDPAAPQGQAQADGVQGQAQG